LRNEGREESEGDEVRKEGSEFQMNGAAKEKDRRPSSELMRGRRRRFWEEDRSERGGV